jgi:hypothetical protein
MRQVSLSLQNPEQQQLFSQTFGGISPHLTGAINQLGGMASGGNEQDWQKMEAPAMRQFGALQGNIASRFSGMGSGARNSSGFQNTMGEAGTDLAERLAGNRMNFQQQALRDLLGLSQSLMGQRTHENALIPEEMPFWKQLLAALSAGTSTGAGLAAGMAGGSWLGKKIG